MTKSELKKVLVLHKLWLKGDKSGVRADFSNFSFSGFDFSRFDFSEFDFTGILFIGADFSNSNFSFANFNKTRFASDSFIRCNFNNANFTHTIFSNAVFWGVSFKGTSFKQTIFEFTRFNKTDFSGVDFTDTDFYKSNFKGAYFDADFSNCDFKGSNFCEANFKSLNFFSNNFHNVDISGAKGLSSPSDYLETHFEKTKDGFIAYKTFNNTYYSPDYWEIKEGSVIKENVNHDVFDGCGCGINVATFEWVKKNADGEVWKVLIEWPWLADVVVPFTTDGKIRCGKVRLIEKISSD